MYCQGGYRPSPLWFSADLDTFFLSYAPSVNDLGHLVITHSFLKSILLIIQIDRQPLMLLAVLRSARIIDDRQIGRISFSGVLPKVNSLLDTGIGLFVGACINLGGSKDSILANLLFPVS